MKWNSNTKFLQCRYQYKVSAMTESNTMAAIGDNYNIFDLYSWWKIWNLSELMTKWPHWQHCNVYIFLTLTVSLWHLPNSSEVFALFSQAPAFKYLFMKIFSEMMGMSNVRERDWSVYRHNKAATLNGTAVLMIYYLVKYTGVATVAVHCVNRSYYCTNKLTSTVCTRHSKQM